MATTISVSEETRKALMRLKLEADARNLDQLVAQLLVDHKKLKFLEASALFRERLAAKGLRIEDLLS